MMLNFLAVCVLWLTDSDNVGSQLKLPPITKRKKESGLQRPLHGVFYRQDVMKLILKPSMGKTVMDYNCYSYYPLPLFPMKSVSA